MSQDELPPAVRRFLDEHIRSVAQLEVLLLLQANAGRCFSSAEVGRELRIETAGAEAQLIDLRNRGIVTSGDPDPSAYRYPPANAEVEAAVSVLAHVYAERRVTVISRIYSKPADPLRSFADAFRIRKDLGNG
ncbi:MAG TPA: hypothetical protein VH475_28825 [Tepidisphaeraceae bacterium]